MEDDQRWWLPVDAIMREGNAERQDHGGQQLLFFDVRLDSSILIESVRPLGVGALKRLGSAASPETVRQLMSGGSGGLNAVYSSPWWQEGPGPDNPLSKIADVVEDIIKGVLSNFEGGVISEWIEQQKQKQKPQ
jgi:hypothetical protein